MKIFKLNFFKLTYKKIIYSCYDKIFVILPNINFQLCKKKKPKKPRKELELKKNYRLEL